MTPSTDVCSMHLLSKKDLTNISRDFGLNQKQVFHKNDADSVAAWVEHTRMDPVTKSLVRYVKFQGEDSSCLPTADFMLVVASDAQLLGARQFCAPMRPVCMDSTHGTNAYDFQLTTLLALDEHGEGFPVAFCYSNHVNEQHMIAFLSVVKDAVGHTLADVMLMTDDAEVYYNAWTAIMGEPAGRLLCSWHVDRAWRKNLSRVNGDSELKAIIYKLVRVLMEVTDTNQFDIKLTEFMTAASEDERTSDFATYFGKEYACRPRLWAYCHRQGLRLHHNMHLEAMHRVLKHVHLQGRKVRRLDKSLHGLMRFIRQKMSDRLLKLHRGKWTRHVGGIRNRHQTSTQITADMCVCLEENVLYTVMTKDTAYTVRQALSVPHDSSTCPLLCNECNVCVHTFSCTCLDSALRNTICKHVHAVVRIYSPRLSCETTASCSSTVCDEPQPSTGSTAAEDCSDGSVPDVGLEVATTTAVDTLPDISETTALLQHLAGGNLTDNVEQSAAKADALWASIRCAIQMNKQLAPVAVEQLTKLLSLLTALQNKGSELLPPLPSNAEPVNKKVTTQRYFRRTRLSRKKNRAVSITKPTSDEQQFLLQSLGGNVPVISHQPPVDHDYSEDVISRTVHFEHAYTAR